MGNNVFIYELIDPRNGLARYVGVTKNSLQRRLNQHISDAKRGGKSYRCKWIRKLISLNLLPVIRLIETVSEKEREEKEKYWISFYGRENLVNGTDGGEGVLGLIVSEETKKKLSESHLGQTPWNKGVNTDTSHLKDFQFKKGETPINKGVPHSLETRQKASNAKSHSQYSGVSYQKYSDKWVAQIRYSGTSYYIGCFDAEDKAARAYDVVWMWLSQTDSIINFPELKYEYKKFLEDNQRLAFVALRKKIKYLLKNGGLYYGS